MKTTIYDDSKILSKEEIALIEEQVDNLSSMLDNEVDVHISLVEEESRNIEVFCEDNYGHYFGWNTSHELMTKEIEDLNNK